MPTLIAKYNIPPDKEASFESNVNAIPILAVTLGAGVSGQIIKFGRRKIMLIAIAIGITGAAISMIENVTAIMLGRIIYGFGVGLIAISMPRSMEETVPEHTVGTFGGLYCLSFATAVLTAYLMALILPPDSDTQALIETKKTLWFFGLPILVFVIMLTILLTYLTREPIKFLLTHGNTEEA